MDSYAALINKKIIVPSQKPNYLGVDLHFLSLAMVSYTGKIHVDEDWYIKRYPDIISALKSGTITTPREHYRLYGFYEHRMPYEILVDEPWYLNEYPDIKQAVGSKAYSSGQEHFDSQGYKEGRIPYPKFALKLCSEKD